MASPSRPSGPPPAPPPPAPAAPSPWSFHPLSALLLASTDVVAGGADVAAWASGGLGYVLVLAIATVVAAVLFLVELATERRPVRAGVLAAVGWVLVVIPTPIAGLVGASASLLSRFGRRVRGL